VKTDDQTFCIFAAKVRTLLEANKRQRRELEIKQDLRQPDGISEGRMLPPGTQLPYAEF
jgi:hypothetical protein